MIVKIKLIVDYRLHFFTHFNANIVSFTDKTGTFYDTTCTLLFNQGKKENLWHFKLNNLSMHYKSMRFS